VIEFPLESDEQDLEARAGGTCMTLCIAAACLDKKEPRIVTCTDWKSTTALGSSDAFDKFKRLKPGWIALLAGKASRAKEMVAALVGVFKTEEVTSDNAVTLVKKAAAAHARNLKEEYCAFRFGMDYDRFQQWCREVNPALAKPYVDELTQLKWGASLLVAGFVTDDDGDRQPLILKMAQASSEVTHEEHFGAIGEGMAVAVPPLLRREYDWEDTSLGKAIYYLYESKTLAEIIDSVGPSTSIDVLYPNGDLKSVTKLGYDYYDDLLKRFGPKPKATGVKLKDEHLGPFEDESDSDVKAGDIKQRSLSRPSASPKLKSKRQS
jgi:hypothetical protein